MFHNNNDNNNNDNKNNKNKNSQKKKTNKRVNWRIFFLFTYALKIYPSVVRLKRLVSFWILSNSAAWNSCKWHWKEKFSPPSKNSTLVLEWSFRTWYLQRKLLLLIVTFVSHFLHFFWLLTACNKVPLKGASDAISPLHVTQFCTTVFKRPIITPFVEPQILSSSSGTYIWDLRFTSRWQ